VFAFNPAHNILSDNNSPTVPDNRLKTYNGTTYYYDHFGNLIHRELADGEVQNYFYDLHDQLVKAEIFKKDGTKETWAYTYDALGRRIGKGRLKNEEVSETSFPYDLGGNDLENQTRFVRDGSHLLQEIHPDGRYTYIYTDQDSYEPLAQVHNRTNEDGESRQQIHYFHCDQIGTPREITDDEGNLVWFGDYHGWGKLKSETNVMGTAHQPFRLQNQYCDCETGLHYNFFRYYDSRIGRFNNQDPIGLVGGENFYAFAPNAQVWVDPLGLNKCCENSKVKTEPNTAFFWSGRTDGIGGQHIAADIAKSNGGTTLEMLIEARKIIMPTWDQNNQASIKAWEDISSEYATCASGTVTGVIGKDLRPGNIWENRELLKQADYQEAVRSVIRELDLGKIRVAEPVSDGWQVNEWVKKAVVMYFPIQQMKTIEVGPFEFHDKIPLKKNYAEKGVRVVPHAVAREGAFIASGAILMPSYVNIGAYVDSGTMVDTWATVGSCAQIGKNVHLSGGVGIGGVLEPLQAAPVIIEDDVFVGSRCIVVEGVRVEKEAVLGANVVLTASTKIIDVTGNEPVELKGRVPARSVVIPGSYTKKFPAGEYQVPCALIIGKRKESTDKKTSLNDALRENNVSV